MAGRSVWNRGACSHAHELFHVLTDLSLHCPDETRRVIPLIQRGERRGQSSSKYPGPQTHKERAWLG